MIKFLFVVFFIVFVFPSVFGMICSHFFDKHAAKSKENKPSLTHAQMMSLLETNEKPLHKSEEKKRYEQAIPVTTKQLTHEVQSIILKREIYY